MLTKIFPLWHHKRCFPELHALVHTLKKKKKKKEQAKEVKCGIFWQGRDRLMHRILQHVKPANKTHKSALQLQRWKQKKLGGSGNLIRGGANVLNLSKVTRYLPPPFGPAPAVIQHWCFHRAAAAALSRSPLGGNWEAVALQRPVLLDVCLENPQRPKRWRCGRRQSQKRACMWNGIWTQRQESETSAVTSVYKFIHVTCCAALSSRRDAEILLHTDASLYAAGAQSHNWSLFQNWRRFLKQEQRTIVPLSVEDIGLQPSNGAA